MNRALFSLTGGLFLMLSACSGSGMVPTAVPRTDNGQSAAVGTPSSGSPANETRSPATADVGAVLPALADPVRSVPVVTPLHVTITDLATHEREVTLGGGSAPVRIANGAEIAVDIQGAPEAETMVLDTGFVTAAMTRVRHGQWRAKLQYLYLVNSGDPRTVLSIEYVTGNKAYRTSLPVLVLHDS